jgi:DNA replication and repair protein RecF
MHHVSIDQLLKHNRQKDLMLQRTSGGIHRDDLLVQLGEQPFKTIASQGQRKSLLFALKLAEMEIIKEEKRLSPLLLLDDVFEKLDEERINNLLMKVCSDQEAQIFITDTNCSRLQKQLENLGQAVQSIEL